jgi:hypothetical protein
MPNPDYFSHDVFSRPASSVISPAGQILHAMVAHVKVVIERAFKRYPLDDEASAEARQELIERAMSKAKRALEACVSVDFFDRNRLDDEIELTFEANSDCDKDAVLQRAGAYLYVYERALEGEGL